MSFPTTALHPVRTAFLREATGKPANQIRSVLHRLRLKGEVRPLGKGKNKLWISGPQIEVRASLLIQAIQTDLASLEVSHYGNQVRRRCAPMLDELHSVIKLLTLYP
jgi:hypothetical protein